jgi:DNA-directed RNA polymerase specialized sigma24 family protein
VKKVSPKLQNFGANLRLVNKLLRSLSRSGEDANFLEETIVVQSNLPGDDRPCTREEYLRQANNGSEADETLEALILKVWGTTKGSYAHKKAVRELVQYVQLVLKPLLKFNRKWKSYDQAAEIVYSRDVERDVLVYLSQHIENFVPRGGSILASLKRWLEFNAINKGIDDFRKAQRQDLKPLSTDAAITLTRNGEDVAWELPDDRTEGLDALLAKLDRTFLQAFLQYLQTDPAGRLQACAMKEPCSCCNCLVLVQLLFFHQPPFNKTQAAAELGIDHQALRAHWKRSCLKLLKQIVVELAQDLGYELDKL